MSVVLCTWNGARWLDGLLRSIAEQELLPSELVVSDDASTDDTVAIIEAARDRLPFEVVLLRNPTRLGSTANFGRALEHARGRIVALADQDDVWYPHKLRRIVDEMTVDPTLTMVFSDADLIREDGRVRDESLWQARRVGRSLRANPVVSVTDFARRGPTTGCTMAVRRRAVEAALPLPALLDDPAGVMRHDRWLSLVAAAVGTARACPDRLMGFRVHPSQETGVLVDGELGTALGRAAGGVLRGTTTAPEHRARAAQLDEAADRADTFGDFASARDLRTEADHHRFRARVADGRAGAGEVVSAAVGRRYGHDPFALAAIGADVVRSLRHRRGDR